MNCKEAKCIHYAHKPADGIWCKVNGELYRKIITGELPRTSQVTASAFRDGSICGDYNAD
jgi:hypothetical protein